MSCYSIFITASIEKERCGLLQFYHNIKRGRKVPFLDLNAENFSLIAFYLFNIKGRIICQDFYD